MKELPLELGDVAPGRGFERMEMGYRWDGLPEGVHTGGPFLRKNVEPLEVWKPLSGMSGGSSERYPTNEWECLEAMGGYSGFPVNWEKKKRNGRQWLVRPWCEAVSHPTLEEVLYIEQAVRALNKAHWEIGDAVTVMRDPEGRLFISDLSAAHKYKNPDHLQWCNEWDKVTRWMRYHGYKDLSSVRERAKFLHGHLFGGALGRWKKAQSYPHVYALLVDDKGALGRLRSAMLLEGEEQPGKVRVYWWILTKNPASQVVLDGNPSMVWGWSPIDE